MTSMKDISDNYRNNNITSGNTSSLKCVDIVIDGFSEAEFVKLVGKYVKIDDTIREKQKDIGELKKTKAAFEEIILSSLVKLDRDTIEIKDGKLKRCVVESLEPIKKDMIIETMIERLGKDSDICKKIMEEANNKRQQTKRINLKRTRKHTQVAK